MVAPEPRGPALRASHVGRLARHRLAACERRAHALERGDGAVAIAREDVDADAKRPYVDQRPERVLPLEVQLRLGDPARGGAAPPGEGVHVAEAEGAVAGRLVVADPHCFAQRRRHVGLEPDAVLARLEAEQAPQPERERVAVAIERDRRLDMAGERVRLPHAAGEEERQGQAALGHQARPGVELRIAEQGVERVDRAREAVGDRGVGEPHGLQPPLPVGVGRPALGGRQQRLGLGLAAQAPEKHVSRPRRNSRGWRPTTSRCQGASSISRSCLCLVRAGG